jgi:uncharacterized protein
MKPKLHELTQSHLELLQDLVTIIKEAVNVEIIIPVSVHWTTRQTCSFFLLDKAYEEQFHVTFLIILHPDFNQSDSYAQDVIEGRCRKRALVTAIVHAMSNVRTLLEKGNSFFTTLCKEESILYNAGRISFKDCFIENAQLPNPFAQPQSSEKWLDTARTFLLGAQFFVENELYRISAFMLHQAVEHTLIGLIQVYTGYRSNTHNIDKLLRYSEIFTTKMKSIFPRNTVEELELFRRLHEAYINSRYKDDYDISVKDAHILLNRVNELHKLGEQLAGEKLAASAISL